jgi:Protein of unknown function (DUF3467)
VKASTIEDKRMADAKPKSNDAPHTEEKPKPNPAAADQRPVTTEIDDSHAVAGYANFCRVSSTPEELILDLGLNPNPYAQGMTTIKVTQRIIMNHFTAKRLLGALSMSLQRHEQAFGVLETDVRKRIQSN